MYAHCPNCEVFLNLWKRKKKNPKQKTKNKQTNESCWFKILSLCISGAISFLLVLPFYLAWCLSCRRPRLLSSFVDSFFHSCLLSSFLSLSPRLSLVYRRCFFFFFSSFHCHFSSGFSSVFTDGSTLCLATCCPAWIGTSMLTDYIQSRLFLARFVVRSLQFVPFCGWPRCSNVAISIRK